MKTISNNWFILVFTLMCCNLNSQQKKDSINIELPALDITQSISLTDHLGNIHTIYKVHDYIKHVTLNTDLQLVNEDEYYDSSISRKQLIGYNITALGKIQLYLSSNIKRKFNLVTIFKNKMVNNEIDYRIKGEKIILPISHGPNFMLLTVDTKESAMYTYTFKGSKVDKKGFSFNQYSFYDVNGYKTSLSSIIGNRQIEFVDTELPTSLEQSSSPIKIYLQDDKIILTLNHRDEETTLLFLDLLNMNGECKLLSNPKLPMNLNAYNGNSFVLGDKIYQITASPKALAMAITDLNNYKRISYYSFTENDSISFNHTPMKQEYNTASVTTFKEIETKRFLRKISNYDIGISANKVEDNIVVTLGAARDMNSVSSEAISIGALYGATGAILYSILSPTSRSYDFYSRRMSVHIKSLFSPINFKNIEGVIGSNVFDKVKTYKHKTKFHKTSLRNFTKLDDGLILSYYIKKEQKLHLVKFNF